MNPSRETHHTTRAIARELEDLRAMPNVRVLDSHERSAIVQRAIRLSKQPLACWKKVFK